jgi:hypothetical protein
MTIELDHTIVPSHDRTRQAQFLADLLGVEWEEPHGEFAPVYVNQEMTFDFQDRDDFTYHHYCFRVSDEGFDEIFGRIKDRNIPYRSSPRGETDYTVRTRDGGKNIYWTCADGHIWEILTVSYARKGYQPDQPQAVRA